MSIICNGVKCIDLKGPSPHTPTPCSPKQQALFDDLRAREERGETERYYGWSDAGADSGFYNPSMNKPSTWMSDEDAKEWVSTCGNKHIQTMQKYQEKRMLHYLMQEKLKELQALKDRLNNR